MQHKLLGYFTLFVSAIFAILWTFQIVFFNTFYEQMKIREVEAVAKTVISEYGDSTFSERLFQHSFRSGFIIRIFNESGHTNDESNAFRDPDPHRRDRRILSIVEKIKENNGKATIYVSKNEPDVFFPSVNYGVLLEKGKYLIIQAPLNPTNTSISVIKLQLLMVTILTALLALLLSFIISERLSGPIKRMTVSSERLAKGDYSARFDGSGYAESVQLADTLNYATGELAKTDELRKDLVANVSHDLKTPLTIIKSYSELIRDISGNNEEKRNQHIETIINESDRMSQLITDILDISRMEASLAKAAPEKFNLSEVLHSVYEAFTAISDYSQYNFSIDAPKSLTVYADINMIRRVIYNLLGNAAKFTGADKRVSVKLYENRNKARVEIKDTGKGIPADELNLVWDKYMQSSMTHHRPSQGTGLGLSIVKQILLLHNADFGVESKPDEGSLFWFELEIKE